MNPYLSGTILAEVTGVHADDSRKVRLDRLTLTFNSGRRYGHVFAAGAGSTDA